MSDSIRTWNQIAMDVAQADFSSPSPSVAPSPQQAGPTYVSRALAIVHLAMYDAYMGATGTNIHGQARKTYLDYADAPGAGGTSVAAAQAAVAAAACLTLVALFDQQKSTILTRQTQFLAGLVGPRKAIESGLAWGRLVALKMLAERAGDGSDASNELYNPSAEPFRHRPDPLNPAQGFLGPLWGQVKPFGFEDLERSIAPLPDPVTLADYEKDYTEVYAVGRDVSATRTPAQTATGLFWAYDSARNLGVPILLYNQAVRAVLAKHGRVDEPQAARIFAMVHVAMADAGIQAWHEKYKWSLWRPVVGIREADSGFGPTGQGDGKFSGKPHGDPFWQPLGSQPTNRSNASPFTPGFPSYPSGHATFGTACLRAVERELQLQPRFTFELSSGELDGISTGASGVRTACRRTFTIDQAIMENVLSRVYLGVHWRLDGLMGEQIGEQIAEQIVANFPAKVPPPDLPASGTAQV
jgi:Vanadium chloroperoxidase N-terminal domain/PAP2 superfamily